MGAELFTASKEARFNRVELNNGLRDQKISKAPWCLLCGEKTDLEGHHGRYGKDAGLVVDWLCPACHGAADERRRSRERGEGAFEWADE